MTDGDSTASGSARPRGRHRPPDDDDDFVVDEELVSIDTTPTGRHSRVELEAMLAADGLDAVPADVAVAEAAPEADAAAAPKTPKAGRNLPAATAVGIGLAGAVVASLAFRREAFLALVLIAVTYAIIELRQAFRAAQIQLPVAPLIVGGIAMNIGAWERGEDGLVIGLLLTCVGVALWRIGDGAKGYGRDVGAGLFVALYVPFLAGFAVLLAYPSDGAGRIIAFVLTVVCSDVGGYAVGVLFGRHPMAPMVSPKKSWEGFAGSTTACVIAGSLLFALLFHEPWWQGALYGLAIVVTATLGDLGESMLKRGIGIKDMGTLLPGHGGLMDRLDSLLPSAAVSYLLFSAFIG